LDFRGGGLTMCERAQLDAAKSFGDKAINYLAVFSGYAEQLARDPHVATNYGSVTDDEAKAAVTAVVNDLASKFRAEIDAQTRQTWKRKLTRCRIESCP